MASKAYCIFCFEVLSSSFQGSEPPPLSKVEELWESYQIAMTEPDEMETDAADSDQEEEEDTFGDGANVPATTLPPSTTTTITTRPKVPSLQTPAISRLQSSASSNTSNSSLSTQPSSAASTTSSQTSYSTILRSPAPEPSYPIFVTWDTISSRTGSKHLRGCIGTFEPLPISRGLETYALTSAFDDHRFNPIPSSLLPQLSCSITLLADFTTAKHPLDWDLGTHGIRISFTNKAGTRRYGATYLPDVAVEQGWTKEETLESLMRKAGWDGSSSTTTSSSNTTTLRKLLRTTDSSPSSSSSDSQHPSHHPWSSQVQDFKLIKYTGLKASASYSDWRDWKRWLECEEH